jgi:hypothetical protein
LHNDAAAVELVLADDVAMTTADRVTYNKAQTVASVKGPGYKPDALQSSDMVVHALATPQW